MILTETPMSRHSTAIMLIDIHKHGNKKKMACTLQNSKDKLKNKPMNSALRLCLHTVAIM